MTKEIDLWVAESPMQLVEGEQINLSLTWTGKVSGGSPSSDIYLDGLSVKGDCFSGADSISNGSPPVQTIPQISNLKGDNKYVVNFIATVDGNKEIQKLELDVVKPGATM